MKLFQYIVLVVVFQVGFLSVGKTFTANQTAAHQKMVKPTQSDSGELQIGFCESLNNTEESETENDPTMPLVTFVCEISFECITSKAEPIPPILSTSLPRYPLYLQTGKLSI